MPDRRYYCVYILASLSGTFYTGMSGYLHRRIFQHKTHHFPGFTATYEVTRLLHFESYDDVHKALARERQLKGWSRKKKIALIEQRDPHWLDLAKDWYPWMEGGSEIKPLEVKMPESEDEQGHKDRHEPEAPPPKSRKS